MTSKYASGTDVTEDRSIAEIRKELLRFGASGFFYGEDGDRRRIAFEYRGLRVQFDLAMPDRYDPSIALSPTGRQRRATSQQEAFDQEVRRRWRSLAMVIKAKLVAVDDNVATFEREFLAYVVLPGGGTIGDRIVDDLDTVAHTGNLPSLLGDVRGPIALGTGK